MAKIPLTMKWCKLTPTLTLTNRVNNVCRKQLPAHLSDNEVTDVISDLRGGGWVEEGLRKRDVKGCALFWKPALLLIVLTTCRRAHEYTYYIFVEFIDIVWSTSV